jgi:hypothetical protein
MEHREPVTASDGTRRFARFVVARRVRRLALTRIGLAGVALTLTVAASIALANLAARWLREQRDYQLPFRAITLDPPPPPWYRGEAGVFLDRVRNEDPAWETISVLGVDFKELAGVFRLNCWVDKVLRVERAYPNRLVVHLQYLVPVAVGQESAGAFWVIDKNGVILPHQDIDEKFLDRLIQVVNLDPPFDPQPGRVWKSQKGANGQAEGDARVLAAAKLADYLRTMSEREKPLPSPEPFHFIHIQDQTLFVQYGPSTMFRWGEPPGNEAPGQLTAAEKWTMLREWVETHPNPPDESPSYLVLEFTKTGIKSSRRTSPRSFPRMRIIPGIK